MTKPTAPQIAHALINDAPSTNASCVAELLA